MQRRRRHQIGENVPVPAGRRLLVAYRFRWLVVQPGENRRSARLRQGVQQTPLERVGVHRASSLVERAFEITPVAKAACLCDGRLTLVERKAKAAVVKQLLQVFCTALCAIDGRVHASILHLGHIETRCSSLAAGMMVRSRECSKHVGRESFAKAAATPTVAALISNITPHEARSSPTCFETAYPNHARLRR